MWYNRKSFLLFALIFLFAFCLHANAQLNTKDTLSWKVKLSASGSLLDGNVARLLLVNRLEAGFANNRWGISTRNDYQYGTTRHSKTENDLVSYNFLYLYPLKKTYPYLMALVETNYRRQIQFRYQFGPGVSYTMPAKGNNLLRISLTGTYEYSRFGATTFKNFDDTSSSEINVWRFTGRLFGKQALFQNKLRLLYEFWWQQSVTDYRNYRFYNEAALEMTVNKKLNLMTRFMYTFENVRLTTLKPYDLFWTFGLSLSNY